MLKTYRCKECEKTVRPKIESIAYDKRLCAKCLDKKYTATELLRMQFEKEARQGQ